MKKNTIVVLAGVLLLTLNAIVNPSMASRFTETDFDPLVDVEVTVDIQTIRFLEEDASAVNVGGTMVGNFDVSAVRYGAICENYGTLGVPVEKTIVEDDGESKASAENPTTTSDDANLYLKVFINEWVGTKYIYDPQWTATLNVPDDQEFVDIKIQLWHSMGGNQEDDKRCDISGDIDDYDVELTYSIKTGHWTGDDELSDPSGYGRLCGCDDGTIYERNRDSEIWFNINQNDYDGDDIPYWTEVNDYGTDPEVSNIGEDSDGDDIPIEWEWKWGYDPFVWENHEELDPDEDSISNYEEYLTLEWFSDPFRKDVYVELDLMDEGPNGEKSYFPVNAKELIQTAFDRQNIIFHLDYGEMGGHEIIPFDEMIEGKDLRNIYNDYFLHGNNDNWRRGVFHYGVVVYKSESAAGYMFRPNAFQISSHGHEALSQEPGKDRDIVYGSAYMHELGHTFGFWPIPGHTRSGGIFLWLYNLAYKSCMNYAWMYKFVDYSDGSRRAPDLNDWDPNRMIFDYFEGEWMNGDIVCCPEGGETSSVASKTITTTIQSIINQQTQQSTLPLPARVQKTLFEC